MYCIYNLNRIYNFKSRICDEPKQKALCRRGLPKIQSSLRFQYISFIRHHVKCVHKPHNSMILNGDTPREMCCTLNTHFQLSRNTIENVCHPTRIKLKCPHEAQVQPTGYSRIASISCQTGCIQVVSFHNAYSPYDSAQGSKAKAKLKLWFV